MGRALLDINVLIALLDQGHLLHRPTTRWLEQQLEQGWATCPINDAYLLALAASQGGCFASFDQRISLDVVPSAEAHHLCLIPCT